MLRKLLLGAFALSTIFAPVARSEELNGQKTPAGRSVSQSLDDLYMLCAFYPKPGTCDAVYRQAMKDSSVSAQAVRDEYMGYARYLYGSSTLTESDHQYLKDNGILVPRDLSLANQAGLHNVITDATLYADAKRSAVNNFLSRAVQAELYCGFNKCDDPREQMTATGT